MPLNSLKRSFAVLCLVSAGAFGQEPVEEESGPHAAAESAADPEPVAIPGGNRMLGVLPNYRSASASAEGTVLTKRQKLYIARRDATDYPIFLVTGVFAGLNQISGQQPEFGQGTKGFARRYATNYVDLALNNYFAEGVFPALLHQDPRYFVRGSGSKWARAGYALSRVLITRQDGKGTNFNYSEWLGASSAVALSNIYYPDGRNFTNNYRKVLWQVGNDALGQLLREFWPDIQRKFFQRQPRPAKP